MPLLKIPACTLYLEVQILATQKEILKMEIPYNESSMTRVPIRRSAAFQFHKAAVPFTRIGPFTGAVRAATLHMWLRGWHSLLVSALRTGETTDERLEQFNKNSDGGSVEVHWFLMIFDSPAKTQTYIHIHYILAIYLHAHIIIQCVDCPSHGNPYSQDKHGTPHRTLSHRIFLRRHCRSPTWNWEQLWFLHKSSTIQPSQ